MTVFHNLKWSTIANIIITIGGMALLWILVRYVPKEDFGIMSIAQLFWTYALVWIDAGTSNAIIYRQNEDKKILSIIFTASILISVAIFFIFQILSKICSFFFSTTVDQSIFSLLSIGVLLAGWGSIFQVVLRERQQVDQVWKSKLIAFMISFFVTIGMAINGYGVYALVGAILVQTGMESLVNTLYGSRFFFPKLNFEFREALYFFQFGKYQILERSLNFFHKQMDVILLAGFIPSNVLGVYDVFKKMLAKPLRLINPVLNSVLFPYMSSLEDERAKDQVYLSQMSLIFILNFAIYTALFFNANLIVEVFFQDSWLPYVPVFKLLAIMYGVYALGNPIGNLLMSKGKKKMSLIWNVIVIILITIAVYLGSHTGAEGVALYLAIFHVVIFVLSYFMVIKKISTISFYDFFLPCIKSLILISITNVGIAYLFGILTNSIVKLILVGVVSLLVIPVYFYFLNPILLKWSRQFIKQNNY